MDQVAPHDSILVEVLMGGVVVVIVLMMISTITQEANETILLFPAEPSRQQEVTPRGASVI